MTSRASHVPTVDAAHALATARDTLQIEIASLQALAQRLDQTFVQVVQAMLATAEGLRKLRHQKTKIIERQAVEIEDLKRQVKKLGG